MKIIAVRLDEDSCYFLVSGSATVLNWIWDAIFFPG